MGFVKKQRKNGSKLSGTEFREVFWGIVEAGFLMAAADGELDESELDAIAGAIIGMVDDVTVGDVRAVFETALASLEEEGWEARVAAVGENLRGSRKDNAALAAMKVASVVYLADGDGDDEEDEAFYQLAESLGYEHDAADEIYNEVAAEFE